jgi:S-adenosylmethionine hydrolase
MTLGADVDPGSLVPSPVGATAAAGRSGGEPALVTTAVWIDRFGNVQLNAGPGDLGRLAPGPGATVRVTVGDASTGRTVPARQVVAFAELEPDEVGVIVDSAGRLAVVLDRASAAERLGVPGPGVVITLTGPPVSGRPR